MPNESSLFLFLSLYIPPLSVSSSQIKCYGASGRAQCQATATTIAGRRVLPERKYTTGPQSALKRSSAGRCSSYPIAGRRKLHDNNNPSEKANFSSGNSGGYMCVVLEWVFAGRFSAVARSVQLSVRACGLELYQLVIRVVLVNLFGRVLKKYCPFGTDISFLRFHTSFLDSSSVLRVDTSFRSSEVARAG
jgi:hypothetical protein